MTVFEACLHANSRVRVGNSWWRSFEEVEFRVLGGESKGSKYAFQVCAGRSKHVVVGHYAELVVLVLDSHELTTVGIAQPLGSADHDEVSRIH